MFNMDEIMKLFKADIGRDMTDDERKIMEEAVRQVVKGFDEADNIEWLRAQGCTWMKSLRN